MRVSVLASGSSGNSAFVQIGDTKLLIDAGISARRIKKNLLELGVALEEINGVLITHEHRDHVNGLAALTQKYGVPVYARPDTFRSMYCYARLNEMCCHNIGDSFSVGSLKIETFNTSHDAVDPVGFSIYGHNKKCTVVTDLGFVTSNVQKALDHSDVLILEANHDVEMLQKGSYPWYLKQRILSNKGHLSNSDAAWALVRMKKKQRTNVLLAHLSEENNCPDTVRDTVFKIVEGQGYLIGSQLNIKLAKQHEVVSI